MTDKIVMTNKIPLIEFNRKNGIFRIGSLIALTGKGYAMLGIAGIGHISLSRDIGNSVTIRIPGGTATTSKWRKFSRTGSTTLTLPKQ